MNDRAIGDVFAVDPGLNAPGAAVIRGGKVIAAERVRIDPDYKDLPIGERCQRVASDVIRWGLGYDMQPKWLVFEWPKAYWEKDKVDKNDLFGLAGIGMSIAGQLAMAMIPRQLSLEILSPTASEWAGNLPKAKTGDPWESPRGQRVKKRLDQEEYLAVGVKTTHDAVDAAAIGLWAVGRWEAIRVFHGALPG